jgi:beta-glucosidase-like glycosyl hydrolase
VKAGTQANIVLHTRGGEPCLAQSDQALGVAQHLFGCQRLPDGMSISAWRVMGSNRRHPPVSLEAHDALP